jgi:nucleotidyltransferase/DNA polymerase involved in DNA repair
MQLLCIHVPSFRLETVRGGSERRPAILTDKPDRGRVIETDAAAHELGARRGHTVLQACAAAGGGLQVLVHDALQSRAIWSDMLDALDAVSPLIDDAGEGTAYLDMRGIAAHEAAWIAHARAVLERFALPVRVAAGTNKFAAFARTYAPDGRIERLPVEMLQIDPRAAERLHLLGVHTLKDLAALPHGPFVRRFGKEAAAWHDRARGIDPTPLRPRAHELQIDAAAYGEGSAEAEEQVIFALRILADRICGDLERAGRAAGMICVGFECENGDTREIEAGFAQATGDARVMLDVVRAKLEGVAFESPVTGLRMQALQLGECGVPATLFGQSQADPQALAVALARLAAVTGSIPRRARTRPAAQLERRFVFEDFGGTSKPPDDDGKKRLGIVPQLRLLQMREIAVTLRGNALDRVLHRRVVNWTGPWRVDDGWFADRAARDEYDVLLEDGMLCRIYRQEERWFLRGAYD